MSVIFNALLGVSFVVRDIVSCWKRHLASIKLQNCKNAILQGARARDVARGRTVAEIIMAAKL